RAWRCVSRDARAPAIRETIWAGWAPGLGRPRCPDGGVGETVLAWRHGVGRSGATRARAGGASAAQAQAVRHRARTAAAAGDRGFSPCLSPVRWAWGWRGSAWLRLPRWATPP